MAPSTAEPVELFEIILLLLALVIPLELAARRLRLPPAAALIVGGMVLAVLPGRQTIGINPDLILVLFLPPLLQASAFFTVWRDFRANLRVIMGLALGAVAFTTFVVGVAAHWAVPTLPWAACFALGAIVSPPDAVAAKAVLQTLRLPPRVTVLLEGESLVNDASGLVLFRFAVVAALTGSFSAGQAAWQFGVLSVGGVVAGVVVGHAAVALLARLRDASHTIVASLLVSWVAYIGADALGVSGVLATVASGLVMGWKQHEMLPAAIRRSASEVWQVVEFVLESLIFILIGLSLRGVVADFGASGVSTTAVVVPVLVVVAAVVVSRFVWLFPAAYLPRLLSPVRQRSPRPPVSAILVLGWAGMRGVVSLAAALSLPEAMPGRDFIIVATFTVILVTVLIQGATLAPLVHLLGVERLPEEVVTTLSIGEVRVRLATAQLVAIEQASAIADGTQRHPRLLEQYTYRLRAATKYAEAQGGLAGARSAHFDAVLAAIAAARTELLHMRRDGTVHDSVVRTLEQELDLEEMTARRHREP